MSNLVMGCPVKIYTFPQRELIITPVPLSGYLIQTSDILWTIPLPPPLDSRNFLCRWGMDIFWNDPIGHDVSNLAEMSE